MAGSVTCRATPLRFEFVHGKQQCQNEHILSMPEGRLPFPARTSLHIDPGELAVVCGTVCKQTYEGSHCPGLEDAGSAWG
jgi:hypothetical protein